MLLGLIVAATQHWRPLTGKQRSALRRAVKAALGGDGQAPPRLPADTHPATRRSLERRGLVGHGQLTQLGVDVVAYAIDRRPIRTATTTGGRL